jgi:hypothetical protein
MATLDQEVGAEWCNGSSRTSLDFDSAPIALDDMDSSPDDTGESFMAVLTLIN